MSNEEPATNPINLESAPEIVLKSPSKIKRNYQISNILKDKYTLMFLAILSFAIIIRLYYFFITKDQAVWWDAAEYLVKAKSWAFGVSDSGWNIIRPIGFSLFAAGIYKLGGNEITLRIIEFIFSILGIFLTYFVAKELYNKKIGLVASFLMSVFWLHLFYTNRLLLGLPSTVFWLVTILFFLKGYVNNKNQKYLLISGLFAGVGFLIYQFTGFVLLVLFLYLIITEKYNFIKNKYSWTFLLGALSILVPLAIYNQINYGIIFPMLKFQSTTAVVGANLFTNFFNYARFFPTYFTWALLPIFLIGLIISLDFLLGLDLIWKGEIDQIKNNLFIILWMSVVFFLWSYTAYGGKPMEPRYLQPFFPAAFMVTGVGLFKIKDWLSKINKKVAILVILLILIIGAGLQLSHADDIINGRKDSYMQIKEASLWIKENTNKDDIVVTSSGPFVTYYAERETVRLKYKESKLYISNYKYIFYDLEEFKQFIEEANPKYLMLSVYESHQQPDWIYEYTINLTVAKAYMLNENQPSLVIYDLRN